MRPAQNRLETIRCRCWAAGRANIVRPRGQTVKSGETVGSPGHGGCKPRPRRTLNWRGACPWLPRSPRPVAAATAPACAESLAGCCWARSSTSRWRGDAPRLTTGCVESARWPSTHAMISGKSTRHRTFALRLRSIPDIGSIAWGITARWLCWIPGRDRLLQPACWGDSSSGGRFDRCLASSLRPMHLGDPL